MSMRIEDACMRVEYLSQSSACPAAIVEGELERRTGPGKGLRSTPLTFHPSRVVSDGAVASCID